MAQWTLQLPLDPDHIEPLFVQIATGISDAIRVGRLEIGARLPGSRTLAGRLGVHRNTVIAAYDELVAQGWLETREARGTFVSSDLPAAPQEPRGGEARPCAYSVNAVVEAPISGLLPRGVLHLKGGMPDLRLVPHALIARAYRRALRHRGAELLGYGDTRGLPALRAELARMLGASRGIAVVPDGVLVTRGSQMALFLAASLLLQPGDLAAVEAFGYQPAWAALRQAGATLLPIPVDDDGLDVDALERSPHIDRIRLLYTTPHHQYPTLAVMSAPRRIKLLSLARRYGFAIVEDDYDHEFHYGARPVLPLLSDDASDVVVYIGSLSKVLAPGLRVGYMVAHPSTVASAAHLRRLIDRQGDQPTEAALAELLELGELQRHVHRMRRVYQSRRDALLRAVGAHLGGVMDAPPPRGGMAVWASVAPHIDVDAWARRALKSGVAFSPGLRYSFGGEPVQRARLGFAALNVDEIDDAVRRMATSLPP